MEAGFGNWKLILFLLFEQKSKKRSVSALGENGEALPVKKSKKAAQDLEAANGAENGVNGKKKGKKTPESLEADVSQHDSVLEASSLNVTAEAEDLSESEESGEETGKRKTNSKRIGGQLTKEQAAELKAQQSKGQFSNFPISEETIKKLKGKNFIEVVLVSNFLDISVKVGFLL